MTARQPEGGAAEIQQQVKSKLIITCNDIRVFELIVWFFESVYTFVSRDINTMRRMTLHPQVVPVLFLLSQNV